MSGADGCSADGGGLAFAFPARAGSAGSGGSSGRASASPPLRPGVPGGHHPAHVGDTLKGGRYRVLARLGAGHFSTVWLAFDGTSARAVAVKIQKSSARYTDAALDEILLLRGVLREDPSASEAVVSLLDSFAHSGPNGRHMCLVFQVMGPSLLGLIRRFHYRGVPLVLVRRLARVMLGGLRFLHERAHIVHTDLKPENILMRPSGEEYARLHRAAAAHARTLVARKNVRRAADPPGAPDGDGERPLTKNQKKRMKAKARKVKRKQVAHVPDTGDEIDVLLRGAGTLHPVPSPVPTSMLSGDGSNSSDEMGSSEDRARGVGATGGAASGASGASAAGGSSSGQSAAREHAAPVEAGPEPGSSADVIVDVVGDDPPVPVAAGRGQELCGVDVQGTSLAGCKISDGAADDHAPVHGRAEMLRHDVPADGDTGNTGVGGRPAASGGGANTSGHTEVAHADRPEECDRGARREVHAVHEGVEGGEGAEEPPLTPEGRFRMSQLLNDEVLYRRADACIIDLGNACWETMSSTGVIQTRQYRSPEVITGGRFGPSADMWSIGCMLFELATGEFLFDPHSGRDYDRDEDHLAQMIELLGPVPREVSFRGAHAQELFNRHGELRHIRELSFWSLDEVLRDKYDFAPADAVEFSAFLQQMLRFDPRERLSAAACLQHSFLTAYP